MSESEHFIEFGGKLLGLARQLLKQDPSLARATALRGALDTAITRKVKKGRRQAAPILPAPPKLPAGEVVRARDLAVTQARKEHIATSIAALRILEADEYEAARTDEASRLGVRVDYLDRQVRGEEQKDQQGQGQPLNLKTPEPWAELVDGAALLDEVATTISRYVVLPRGAADAIALWVVFSFAIDFFDLAPRLAILSAVMRSGKTTLVRVLARLVLRGLLASNVSSAAIFRTIEAAHPTMLIDEADSFAREDEALRGLLNSGHARDAAFVVRVEGDNREPRAFSTWGPIAIAAIGALPATWIDRSIVINLKRKLKSEHIERLTRGELADLDKLARRIARWVADNGARLRKADPEPEDGLNDRAADNWRPLLAVADAAGGAWPTRARAAACALSADRDGADSSLGIKLLADIKGILDTEPERTRIGSAMLCDRLVALELSPWGALIRGKPLTPARASRMLRNFEIYVAQDAAGSYYRPVDFSEAFSRYLAPDPPSQSATMPQTPGAVAES